MFEDPIPNDVRRFIIESVDSIAQLEALLLLRGSPDEEWSARQIAERLYISEQETALLLTRLNAQGVITCSDDKQPRCRYRPKSDDLSNVVDRLADTYAKHLVPVTNLIHSKPRTRVQEFADVFKLRKDE